MGGKIAFRTLPPGVESFGIAIDFLARFPPFDIEPLGVFSRVVRRQVQAGEHVVAWDGEGLAGYSGWLPTTIAAAEAWLRNTSELVLVEGAHDAFALTVVAVSDPKLLPGLIRATRERGFGRRIFFKRYGSTSRVARKSAVLNRDFAGPIPSPVGSASLRRPAIADDPCGFLFALAARRPGKTERVALGDETLIVVQDAATAAHVVVANGANYVKDFASFTPLFGDSRLTLDGERWRRSQRITQPHIAPHDAARAEAIIVEQHGQLAAVLLAEGGKGAAIDAIVDRAVIATLIAVAFSADANELGSAFARDLRTSIRYSARRAWDAPGVVAVLDEEARVAAGAATGRVREAVGRLVEHRRSERVRPPDALTALIAAADDSGGGKEPTDLIGEIITMIVAGSDTTSAAIGWALSILAEHKPFQEQLRQEIVAAVGDRAPMLADAERVPSLRPFIDETLRIFPPVPILSRVAVADDVVDGNRVAPGDRVLVSVIGIHQDPSAWDAPREFRLERHAAEARGRPDRRSVFMPFSAGPRICGGMRFAQMELSLALMLILQRCRLDLPAPLPLAFEWGASMRRAGGQRIRLRPL